MVDVQHKALYVGFALLLGVLQNGLRIVFTGCYRYGEQLLHCRYEVDYYLNSYLHAGALIKVVDAYYTG